MNSGHWRRWRPRSSDSFDAAREPHDNPFVAVERRLKQVAISKRLWRKHHDLSELDSLVDGARGHAVGLDKEHALTSERAEAWLYALALQGPRAAVAQEQMDKHPHGYHNKNHRLYELIDFNDAFVSAVLCLPRELLPHAPEQIQKLVEQMCQRAGTRCFSREQFNAIVHGLSREIAVYLGVQKEGFEAEMTNRREDAFGIDMRIIEPSTMKEVGVDIKTRSSYHYRIQELAREGRLSEEGFLMADRNGFTAVINGHGSEQQRVVTWRIDHDELGQVVDFEFEDTTRLAEMLRAIMLRYGQSV